jgi:uncharacterized protein (DUF1800 family)
MHSEGSYSAAASVMPNTAYSSAPPVGVPVAWRRSILIAVLVACALAPLTVRAASPEFLAASRFASRATFGADVSEIWRIETIGRGSWIDEQTRLPYESHDAVVDALLAQLDAGAFDGIGANTDHVAAIFSRLAWWHRAVTAEDQLRQRVTYALSQIFVVSDDLNTLRRQPHAISNYVDMLASHAFGNFGELLLDVALHPSMGVYLSHLNNGKADPGLGTYPDENFARELMQLFSIGLFELNADGSEVRDASGQPLATYNNDDVRELARVFTGLSFGGANRRFGSRRADFRSPMRMFEHQHDQEEKLILGRTRIPPGLPGLEDIRLAIDTLFRHPNVGPFVGRQLIQRLVTSNPSPAYVERVARAFNDNGSGVRGDMKATLRAVLLDPEADAPPGSIEHFGKLREPVLRFTAMLRQLGVSSADGLYFNTGFFIEQSVQQHPLSAPSVFNFYLPSHQPPGLLGGTGLVAPEFQITNSNTVIEIANLLKAAIIGDVVSDLPTGLVSTPTLSLDDYLPFAGDPGALLERMDAVFTYGTLSDATRDAILRRLTLIRDPELRVRVAAWLVLISPDYAVEQ